MQAQFSDRKVAAPGTWRDYVDLTKPGVVAMLLLSALASMFIAADGLPALPLVAWSMAGLLLSSSGACTLNSYIESDLDALMIRTRNRPLPNQRLKASHALRMGLGLVSMGSLIIFVVINPVAGLLNLVGVFLYVVVYTWKLKRHSVYSTFVAGLAGAMPTLVGWAAVTGTLSVSSLVLFAIIFYWTTPHYWSLALLYRNEYTKAGLPMLPVLQGSNAARIQIGRYTVLMVFLTLLPVGMGMLQQYYALVALILGGVMVYFATQLFTAPSTQTTQRYYRNSLLYLALLLAAMLADRAIL